MQVNLEYGVEYYPNEEEGEQFDYLTHSEFLSLLRDHELKGLSPRVAYDHFTLFNNGREGARLTICDDYGLHYG